MHVKLRSADEHQGPFGCVKCFLNRRKDVGMRHKKYQKFPLFGKESPSTGEPLYRLTSKILTAFIRPTYSIKFTDRPKITFLQSCEKIVQCAPAVGVKMWCLLPAVLPQSVKHRGIKFTHGQKSGYSPLRGGLVAPMHVKLCGADEHLGPLGCAKFCLNRCKDVGMGPKNIKNLHFLIKSRLSRVNPLIDF